MPNTNAQTGNLTEIATFPFVDAVPKTTGVDQYTLINYGLLNYLRNANDGWNMTVIITDPDGIVDTFDKMTWSTGMGGMGYTPKKVGNYTLQVTFDGVEYFASTTGTARAYYTPSVSEKVILQVLADHVSQSHPGYSTFPEEYWTRPIDSQLRSWYSIAGSWLVQKSRDSNLFAPYNDAPETAHILWSTPDDQYMGGLAGGFDSIGFQHGDAYEGKFSGAVIVAGVLYYNVAPIYSSGTNGLNQRIKAIDLHTGKTLWERSLAEFGTNARLTRAQVVVYSSLNNRGAWGYLWVQNGTTSNIWHALDPKTGDHIYTMTGVPTGAVYDGPNGEMLIHSVVNIGTTENPNFVLRQWNSTRVVTGDDSSPSGGGSDAWGSQVNQHTGPRQYNASRGNQFEVSLPRNLGAPIMVFPNDRAVFANTSIAGVTLSVVSISEKDFGKILVNQEYWKAPAEWQGLTLTGTQTGWAAFSDDPYVGIFWTKENRVNYAFSLETGEFLWQSQSQIYADAWGGATSNSSPEKVIAYGKLLEASVGGIVYCYDVKDGTLLWTYTCKDPYLESYVTENWWSALLFVSDGKI
ncbi:MAG: PQQ-binding-like beta-propeller repeat protein, partial [Nitrososphaerota archaeon]|nr:PQQ-binding-like beta-propeller repeat protein [Nitrososphaerota archaeon]